ncbi:hypothetical protein SERLA73DRAFT_175839 [Serpula lacrymans var. lacrymans S7.3]|uniref:Uncharacterized protein n=2 Tax=Serpula lacrymans var. lacrymans TaxID=341189 RepID=F8PJF1_SERL3|nr:uncharacterized protein SERLADRAFT_445741 [Serpula lacrymans var. lacrymans S7.9]EGO04089.1 hypothetical protein SERLA73DRAFT_175839 [Serpula lacrymans var. lacrymans S7.3]EGO30010.1 hypothetical protein SERLADRAFT_445741 [Serpula lacrymans var. lacrymans S7.9]
MWYYHELSAAIVLGAFMGVNSRLGTRLVLKSGAVLVPYCDICNMDQKAISKRETVWEVMVTHDLNVHPAKKYRTGLIYED